MVVYDKFKNKFLTDYIRNDKKVVSISQNAKKRFNDPELATYIKNKFGVEMKNMTELKELNKVEEEAIDLSEHEGKKAKIEGVEVVEVPSKYSERGKAWVVKVETGVITEINDIEIKASELFNLKEENGKASGWSSQGNLQQLLDKLSVDKPEELEGKEVTVRVRGEKKFLGFIY